MGTESKLKEAPKQCVDVCVPQEQQWLCVSLCSVDAAEIPKLVLLKLPYASLSYGLTCAVFHNGKVTLDHPHISSHTKNT